VKSHIFLKVLQKQICALLYNVSHKTFRFLYPG